MTTRTAKASGKAARTAKGRMNLPAWVVVTAIVAVIGIVFAYDRWRFAQLPGENHPSQGNAHIATPATQHPPYSTVPPTSGWHTGALVPWGETATVYPDQILVHNLEDGGVLVLYNPSRVTNQERAAVREFLQGLPRGLDHIVFGPYPTMDSAWALVAWTRLANMETFDFDPARRFIAAYRFKDHHLR